MTLDELLAVATRPGRTLRLTWRVDVSASGPGWIAASWDDRPTHRLDFTEVVGSTLEDALRELSLRMGWLS